ncbi:uncharacterized protein LOC125241086 [Leguminivora glycinivorella]|uniref:uncharacterized protein LOC125241086 n=1 Tax=Leguminivora glycinivorella TaxID=1035111 RepID=UPI00200E6A39|nr:uncharacterized protein LOC125241086 [Leguminivora glycinivorella]
MYLKALVLCALLLVSVTATPVARPSNIVIIESLEEPCARQGGLCRPTSECEPENLSQLPNLCPHGEHLGYKCCYLI